MTSHSTLVRHLAVVALAVLALGVTCALAQEMTDDEAAAVAGGLGIMSLVISCISLVVAVGVAIWLYKAAEAAGKSGVGWAIFGFFLPIPAIIVWLIVKPK